MKTGTALKKYFERRRNAIDLLLKKPSRKFTPTDFHQLRIEIKKLKALSALINYKSKSFKRRETFKPLDQIFDHAGKIREHQLEEAILKKYSFGSSLKNYMADIKSLISREQKRFFSILSKSFKRKVNKSFTE